MTTPQLTFSEDQAEAYDRVTEMLRDAGIDLTEGTTRPPGGGASKRLALLGKAGSGKTLLLAELCKALQSAPHSQVQILSVHLLVEAVKVWLGLAPPHASATKATSPASKVSADHRYAIQ